MDLPDLAGKYSRKAMLRPFLLLSALCRLICAVKVMIQTGIHFPGPVQSCNDLLPGQCCRALPILFTDYLNPFNPGSVDFSDLRPIHVAAIWARRGSIAGCSGVPIQTRPGPGNWHREATGDERAFGASYFTLPTKLPVGQTEANWLDAEGVLGLVWGGGRWFAKGAEGMLGDIARGGSRRARSRRRIVSAKRGTAYMRGPKRWRWPDAVEVNGTRYLNSGSVNLLYQDADGKVLNMSMAG